MIAVRADVADSERGARSDLLLDAQAPGEHGGRVDVGLHVAWRNLAPAGGGVPGVMWRLETGDVGEGLGGVEGRGLVEAIVERIEQAVIEAEAAADRGFAVARTSHAKPRRGSGRNTARFLLSADVPMMGSVCRTPSTIA